MKIVILISMPSQTASDSYNEHDLANHLVFNSFHFFLSDVDQVASGLGELTRSLRVM